MPVRPLACSALVLYLRFEVARVARAPPSVHRKKMWVVRRVHNSLVHAGASSEKSYLTARMPEDDCVVGAEPAGANISDQRREGFGRVGVVDKERFGASSHGLRLSRSGSRYSISVADESVVDGDVHAARQFGPVNPGYRSEAADYSADGGLDRRRRIVGTNADDLRRQSK